jgi:hypothetical protein
MTKLTWQEFSEKYCDTQEQTPEGLLEILFQQNKSYQPEGFMLLECHDLGSSRLGSKVILPFGPKNTFKEIPSHPISPRGLASDMSVCIGWLDAKVISECP